MAGPIPPTRSALGVTLRSLKGVTTRRRLFLPGLLQMSHQSVFITQLIEGAVIVKSIDHNGAFFLDEIVGKIETFDPVTSILLDSVESIVETTVWGDDGRDEMFDAFFRKANNSPGLTFVSLLDASATPPVASDSFISVAAKTSGGTTASSPNLLLITEAVELVGTKLSVTVSGSAIAVGLGPDFKSGGVVGILDESVDPFPSADFWMWSFETPDITITDGSGDQFDIQITYTVTFDLQPLFMAEEGAAPFLEWIAGSRGFNDPSPLKFDFDWAVGLIDAAGFSVLSRGDTMASHGNWVEFLGYSETSRPLAPFAFFFDTSFVRNQTDDPAFNFNADGLVRGLFITSDPTKNGVAGELLALFDFGEGFKVDATRDTAVRYDVEAIPPPKVFLPPLLQMSHNSLLPTQLIDGAVIVKSINDGGAFFLEDIVGKIETFDPVTFALLATVNTTPSTTVWADEGRDEMFGAVFDDVNNAFGVDTVRILKNGTAIPVATDSFASVNALPFFGSWGPIVDLLSAGSVSLVGTKLSITITSPLQKAPVGTPANSLAHGLASLKTDSGADKWFWTVDTPNIAVTDGAGDRFEIKITYTISFDLKSLFMAAEGAGDILKWAAGAHGSNNGELRFDFDWAVGLIDGVGFSSISRGDTMASHAGWTEFLGYSGARKLAPLNSFLDTSFVRLETSPSFAFNAEGLVRGVFITSDPTKNGSAGELLAVFDFGEAFKVDETRSATARYDVEAIPTP